MAATVMTPPRVREFGRDLTNTPSPPSLFGRPARGNRPPPTATQRYTLRSRHARQAEAHPYRQRGAEAPLRVLPELTAGTGLGGAVRLCSSCHTKALCGLGGRSCEWRTDEHPEYQLLRELGRRFVVDLGLHRAGNYDVAREASLCELEASFIKVATEGGAADTVAGYVALRPLAPGAAILEQLYVERRFRKSGVATGALRTLLAGTTALELDPRVPNDGAEQVRRLLEKLGFQSQPGVPNSFVRGIRGENM